MTFKYYDDRISLSIKAMAIFLLLQGSTLQFTRNVRYFTVVLAKKRTFLYEKS